MDASWTLILKWQFKDRIPSSLNKMVDIVLCADKQTCNQAFKQGWEKWVVGALHWILRVNSSDREVA